MNKLLCLASFACLLFSSALFSQNWQPAGNVPNPAVAYDQDGQNRWVMTRENVYKSTDGGTSWTQQLSSANAPFITPDLLGNRFYGPERISARDSRIFGDVLFMKVDKEDYEWDLYVSANGGTTMKKIFSRDDTQYSSITETYQVDANTFVLHTIRNSRSPVLNTLWVSTDKGQNWTKMREDSGNNLYPKFVGATDTQFAVLYGGDIFLHSKNNFNNVTTLALPETIQDAKVEGNDIKLATWDTSLGGTSNTLKIYRSTNGGANFTPQQRTYAVETFKQVQFFNEDIFITTNRPAYVTFNFYRATWSDFQNPTRLDVGINSNNNGRATLRLTSDNKLSNLIAGSYQTGMIINGSTDWNKFDIPFIVSDNGWQSGTAASKPPYSLQGLKKFGSNYALVYGRNGYSTTDGIRFTERARFTNATLEGQPNIHPGSISLDTYSDPSSTTYFTNNGINYKRPIDMGFTFWFRDITSAGNNLYIFGDQNNERGLYKSSDNGNNWSLIQDAYQWEQNLVGDDVTGYLYALDQGITQGSCDFEFSVSKNDGVSWEVLPTPNLPNFTSDVCYGYNGHYVFIHDNNIFIKTLENLYVSTNNGASFNAVNTPFFVRGSRMWIDEGKLIFKTQDEDLYTADLSSWLSRGSEPNGVQIDLELSVRMEPPNPAPWSNFNVIVTLTNTGSAPATGIYASTSVRGDVIRQGGVSPTYSNNFAWNSPNNSLAPGESVTGSFPYFRRGGTDPSDIPWTTASITNHFEPDVDSRPGNFPASGIPEEDDEDRFPPVNTSDPCAPDVTPPVLTCPDDFTVTTSTTSAVVNWTPPTATDNCDPNPTVRDAFTNGGTYQLGSITIRASARDASNNLATCAFILTVVQGNVDPCAPDVERPMINCPSRIDRTISGTSATVNWSPATTSDNCDATPTLTSTHQPGSVFQLGATTVTYTSTDDAGNVVSCIFVVRLTQNVDPCNPDNTPPVISNCPSNITRTITGTSTSVSWTEPTATDACSAANLTSDQNSGSTFSLGTTAVNYMARDASNNTATCSFNVTVNQQNTGNGIDLELTLANSPNPVQWGFYTVTATLQNKGSQAANGINVSFPKSDDVAYKGGDEFTASQGNFQYWGNEIWSVGSIPAGGSATLEVNYFLLKPSAPNSYAQVSSMNGTDIDSTPGNGTPPNPNEDDEANTAGGSTNPCANDVIAPVISNCPSNITRTTTGSNVNVTWTAPTATDNCSTANLTSNRNPGSAFSLGTTNVTYTATDAANNSSNCSFSVTVSQSSSNNQPDLRLTNLSLGSTSVAKGSVLNYTFRLRNSGNAMANGNYNIKAYISTNQTIGASDIQDGIVPTGNTAAGANILVPGASSIPSSLAAGDYYLILKADADNQISESNEGNNEIVSSTRFTVTGGTTGGSGADLEISFDSPSGNTNQWGTFGVTLTLSNTGNQTASNVKIAIPKPSGIVYSGGNEATTSTGSFLWYGDESWNVGSIAAGNTETITLNYFRLSANGFNIFAQVSAASGSDPDSSPNNGTCCTGLEDDEAFVQIGSSAANVGGRSSAFEKDEAQVTFLQTVFPNPTTNLTTVRMIAKAATDTEIQVYDNFGRKMYSEDWNLEQGVNEKMIDISNFPAGIYQIMVQPFHPVLRKARVMKID